MRKIRDRIFGSKIRTLEKENNDLNFGNKKLKESIKRNEELIDISNRLYKKQSEKVNDELNGRASIIKDDFAKKLKEYKERECKIHDEIIKGYIKKEVQFESMKNNEYIILFDKYQELKTKYVKLIKKIKL